jgi:hypothetical protein
MAPWLPYSAQLGGTVTSFRSLSMLAVVLLSATLAAFADNVALNKPVTLNGTFFQPTNYACNAPSTPATAGSVVDGVFLPEASCWQDGVSWQGTSPTVDINLNGTFTLTGAKVQADDNDTYQLQYLGTDNAYHDWWSIPTQCCWGLVTRSDGGSLATVTATGLRFFATGGDGYYAVSEIQAYGTPVGNQVPEPASAYLLAAGFAALAACVRRKRR